MVVPARNEAAHVGRTLECLIAQDYPSLSITAVDDQSTDGTAAIIANAGLRVGLVRGVERPAGWVGKTWALEQGVGQSAGEWICMIDADLWLDRRAVSTAMREAETYGADLVSLLGRPVCETFWQRAIGLALVHILASLYPIGRVNDPTKPDALAHGAFVLVRRSVYDRVGGIASVRGEIVEDIRFARRVKEAGGRIVVRPAPTLVQTHMYGGFRDIWRGLRKNAYAGMDYAPHKFATGAILALMFAWVPVVAALRGVASGDSLTVVLGALGWAAMAAAAWPSAVFLGLSPAWGLVLPIGLTAYVAITASSVWHYYRGRVLWKDRVFAAPRTEADRGA